MDIAPGMIFGPRVSHIFISTFTTGFPISASLILSIFTVGPDAPFGTASDQQTLFPARHGGGRTRSIKGIHQYLQTFRLLPHLAETASGESWLSYE